MECVEGALKSSFDLKPDNMGLKPTTHHHPQSFSDDLWGVIGVAGDDFSVDDLLDFSKDGGFVEDNDTHVLLNNPDDNNNNKPSSVSPLKTEHNQDNAATNFSVTGGELCLPADDVADLEWVSHFVDDSFSGGYSLTCPAPGKFPEKKSEPKLETPVAEKPSSTAPVQTRARSKRTRTGGRVWSLGSPQLTESSTSCSSSSSCTSNPWVTFYDSSQTAESVFGKPPVKRQKKKPEGSGAGREQPRRCSHCLVQKTPQWRAGPLGAKTLCNACGVRFKSGRLLPEYRPACSPTFSSDVHSNNHRKVLEMRQKKEASQTGLAPPVQSF